MKPIYKLFYWFYLAGSAMWYWLRRRFTLAGLCAAGGFIVAGAVGTDIENTVTYQSFALLLAILVTALASSFFFRAKFSATRRLPRLGTAGQPLLYRVQVKNLTGKNQAGLTLLEDSPIRARSFRNGSRFNWRRAGASAHFAWRSGAEKIRSGWRI